MVDEKIYEKYIEGEKHKGAETQSGIPVKGIYRPEDIENIDYWRDLGDPGEYPFTRGSYKEMYRGRLWTRRPLTGFGTVKLANERIKFLFKEGGTAWSLAPDSPTNVGLDPDHPLAKYGVGLSGTSLCCLEDMEIYLEGLPLGKISPNFVVCQPSSAFMLACYVALAEKRGIALNELLGGIQNDPFQQFGGMLEAQTGFFDLDLGVKLTCDIIEWCALHAPKINTLCINSYNLREHGITAVEEIAFGLTSATAIIREVLSRGRVGIDDFAPRISFFCASNMDFLEEVAKFRALRRLYARTMKEKFGAKDPASWRLRIAVETSGNSLTTQQPLNNIIRATIESLAAVLGGCQSLYPACFDEGLAIPTEVAATIALRTQQIIAYESNVANVADAMGGSYFIEALTNRLEEEASKLVEEIEEMGGTVQVMKNGWRDERLQKGQHRSQSQIEKGERIVVGLNAFQSEEVELPGGIFEVPPDVFEERIAFIKEFKQRRDKIKTKEALAKLSEKVGSEENLIPEIIAAVKAKATLGETADTLRDAVGFKVKS